MSSASFRFYFVKSPSQSKSLLNFVAEEIRAQASKAKVYRFSSCITVITSEFFQERFYTSYGRE